MRTNVYIDGFNLYYGSLRGSPHKWLDLERFCDRLLPRNEVVEIVYCTAQVHARPTDPNQPLRQQAYLRALKTLPRVSIETGTFLANAVRAPLLECDEGTGRWVRENNLPKVQLHGDGRVKTHWVLKTEEKGSDVNLAARLLRDVYKGNCDCAVIISNDSDLIMPIRMAKEEGAVIGLVPPRPRGSAELKSLADFVIAPRPHHFSNAQFPEEIEDAHGVIVKPVDW